MRIIFALLLIVISECVSTGDATAIGVVLSDKMYTAAKYGRQQRHAHEKKTKHTTATSPKPTTAVGTTPVKESNATAEQKGDEEKREQTAAK